MILPPENDKNMKIYLVRHGQPDRGPAKRYIGWTDLPLDSTGAFQARALGREFSGEALGRIVSSDLERALTTARTIAEAQSVSICEEPAFREVHLGRWDGLTFDEVKARYPGEYEKRGRDLAGHCPPGGESFRDLSRRVLPVFYRLAESEPGPLMIVAHVGVIRVILCDLLGMPLDNLFRLDHACGAFSVIRRAGTEYRLLGHACRPRTTPDPD